MGFDGARQHTPKKLFSRTERLRLLRGPEREVMCDSRGRVADSGSRKPSPFVERPGCSTLSGFYMMIDITDGVIKYTMSRESAEKVNWRICPTGLGCSLFVPSLTPF